MTTRTGDGAATDTGAPVLVTGATGGLGAAVVAGLAAQGVPTLVHGRRRDAVDRVVASARGAGGASDGVVADLADLDQVADAVARLEGRPLGGIVANAGLTAGSDRRSVQGLELTFAVNVLAHQLLLGRLAGQLVDGARVVVVTSGTVDPANPVARRSGVPVPRWVGAAALARPWAAAAEDRLDDPRQRYSTSKLGNALQAVALHERLLAAGQRVDVLAFDPGLMVDTGLARSYPLPVRAVLGSVGRLVTPLVDGMRTSRQSAADVVVLLRGSALDAPAWVERRRALPWPEGVDPSRARSVWDDVQLVLSDLGHA